MRRNRSSRLEAIVANHNPSRATHIIHHPHERIATPVLLVVFFALMFLFGIVLFFVAEPVEMSGMVLVDFHSDEPGILSSIGETLRNVISEDQRTEFLMIMYISWIFIIGAVQLYRIEKKS